jgi:hypothetical protein
MKLCPVDHEARLSVILMLRADKVQTTTYRGIGVLCHFASANIVIGYSAMSSCRHDALALSLQDLYYGGGLSHHLQNAITGKFNTKAFKDVNPALLPRMFICLSGHPVASRIAV